MARHEFPFDESEMKILATVPRIAAGIALICTLYMAIVSFQNRNRLFHRLIFGLSCHVLLFLTCQIYGTWAIPPQVSSAWGARGTVQTCTAQGFLIQVSSFSGYFYYVFLSLYSHMAVLHNFEAAKYQWVEKWIHFSAHVFPVSSALYLLWVEAYNGDAAHGVCWIDSSPRNCGNRSDGDIPCQRGPDNIALVAAFCAALPTIVCALFPTGVMVTLYCKVQRHQSRLRVKATRVGRQAAIYIGALYWSFSFTAIANTMNFLGKDKLFVVSLLSTTNVNLFGIWVLLFYLHFRVKGTNGKLEATQIHRHRRNSNNNNNNLDLDGTLDPPESAGGPIRRVSNTSSQQSRQCTLFNIFDGTNAEGEFADFIFEGDSDDERLDRLESQRWEDIQDHV